MRIIERSTESFFEFIVHHPATVLVLFLVAACALGWQARRFQIDASADTLLMRDDADYIRTRIVNRRFSPQEFLLIAYKPRGAALLSDRTFSDLAAITEKLKTIDRVASVRTILNVPLFTLARENGLSLEDPSQWSMEKQHYTPEQLAEAFRGDPVYEDLLINRDQTATALQVLFRSDKTLEELEDRIVSLQQKFLEGGLTEVDTKRLSQLRRQAMLIEKKMDARRNAEIKTIRNIMQTYEDDAAIYLGGLHVLGYQLIRIIKNDLIVFGCAIAGIICLILYVLFRRWRWVFITILCCGCSVLSTMGLFGLLGLKATVISSNFIALQLIMTLALVIHLIVQYREYTTLHPHWTQARLARETLNRKAGPCFGAGITTAVGFGSLLFSRIQPVIAFGWMMIVAMFFSIVVSLILFPAVMAMLGREEVKVQHGVSRRVLSFFSDLSLNHPRLITGTTICILALSVAGLFRLDVENSFINYFRDDTRVYQELTFIDREFGGSTPLDIVYTIPDAERKKDLVLTADTVQTLEKIQKALQQHKVMGKILSVVNFTALAKKVNNDMPLTEYELTALYWTMEDAPRSDLVGSFFSEEHHQVRFSIRIEDSTPGLDRNRLLSDIRSDLKNIGIPPDRYMLTNLLVLYRNILQQLFRSQILTMGLVYFALTLTFLFIFRSIKLALIGVAPSILSTLAVLGVMGWLGIPLDLMTITIAAIAMGIAVDDTIHYIHRFLEELHDDSAEKSIQRSHLSVGYAMLYTSLIIILGFSLLAFSEFIPSVLFGLLTGLAMAMALIFALSLLPSLLYRFVKRA